MNRRPGTENGGALAAGKQTNGNGFCMCDMVGSSVIRGDWRRRKTMHWGGLFLGLCLAAGCAVKTRPPETRTPPKKLVVLPEQIKDPKLRPYVVNGEKYYPIPDAEGFYQSGKASWYGKDFHGRPTASGEVYDMYKISAAHKTLPLGTWVRVMNRADKREIVVRVNDRGPFVKGRIIDLSYGAAREFGLIGPGVIDVEVVALAREVGTVKSPVGIRPVVEIGDLNRGEFTVQVGAFRDRSNALRLVNRLKGVFEYVEVSTYLDTEGNIFRVRVTKSDTLQKAGEMEKKLEQMGFNEAFIVSL